MDCRQARKLLELGDDAPETERDAALDHLDGCAQCGAIAADLDPLLVFRRLPDLEVSAAEATRMREAVSVLRRAPADPAPPRATGVGLRLAAAVVAACGLWLAPGPLERKPVADGPVAVGDAAAPEYLPSVETAPGTDAYVATQVTEDDLTLVILANVDVAGQ
jgi:hypothetical protein